mmetsp:Transcript_4128/g.6068  ORF Transcript_4128/g.6068 Transcript_4128/m.6068 type:complete len:200 (+) Transcript_4128:986-1585(+)
MLLSESSRPNEFARLSSFGPSETVIEPMEWTSSSSFLMIPSFLSPSSAGFRGISFIMGLDLSSSVSSFLPLGCRLIPGKTIPGEFFPPIFGRLALDIPSSASVHPDTSSPLSTAAAKSRLRRCTTIKFCFILVIAWPSRIITLSWETFTSSPGFDLVPIFLPPLFIVLVCGVPSLSFSLFLASSSALTSLIIFSSSPGM